MQPESGATVLGRFRQDWQERVLRDGDPAAVADVKVVRVAGAGVGIVRNEQVVRVVATEEKNAHQGSKVGGALRQGMDQAKAAQIGGHAERGSAAARIAYEIPSRKTHGSPPLRKPLVLHLILRRRENQIDGRLGALKILIGARWNGVHCRENAGTG